MFDAYTVKKVLPRLVIAAILIQLSWPLFTLLITLVSNIAWGIEGLLYAPFGGRSQMEIGNILEMATGGGGFATAGIGALGLFIGGAVGAALLGTFGLLSLGASILIALLIAFFVLAIRQVLIVVLVVTAPIALVAWILPGTEKFWKLWWESFSKALLMYPLILLLIAGGRIAAYIAAQDRGANVGNDQFQVAIVLIAFFGPFFLIPKTFQVAGSAFANIAGIANDRSRGVFDRLKNGRKERMGARFKRAQDNHLWNQEKYDPNSKMGKFVRSANTLASIGTSNPWDVARLYAGTAGGKGVASAITQAKFKDTNKLAQAMTENGITVDRAFSAIAGENQWLKANNFNRQIRNQKDLDEAVTLLRQSTEENDQVAATQLASASSFLTSAHENEEYGRGDLAAAALMNWSSQGFAGADNIADVSNRIAEAQGGEGGRQFADLVANQAAYMGYKNGGRLDLKPTYGVVPDGNGASRVAGKERKKQLVQGLKQYEWTSAKGSAIKGVAEAVKEVAQGKGWVDESKFESPEAAQAQRDALAYAMRQTVASNAMSSTDPGSRAEWRNIAKGSFEGAASLSDAELDVMLSNIAYGRGANEKDIADRRDIGAPGGGAAGPHGAV